MPGRRLTSIISVVAIAIVLAATPTALAGPAAPREATGRYLVRLADAPLARYAGGTAGLAPTSPAVLGTGRLDAQSPASVAYVSYLARRQGAFLTAAQRALGRSVDVSFRYRYAYNGLAVTLTPTEAQRLAAFLGGPLELSWDG